MASTELQVALSDLQRYLQDQIPPLTVSDAIETLVASAPPELAMRQIHGWSMEQARFQEASQGDLLYHAIRKLHFLAVLRLVEPTVLDPYLDRIFPLALEVCPGEERELLRNSLSALRDSVTLDVSQVVSLGRVESSGAPKSGGLRDAVTGAVTRSAKRLSMVVERLAKRIAPREEGDASAPAPEPPPSAELVTMAAKSATNEAELNAYVNHLGEYTGEKDPAKLFHVLAGAVPHWEVAVPDTMKPPAAIEAMHKILTLTATSHESGRRFRELMTEAVEQFNQGGLGGAVSMFELASKVMQENRVDPSLADRIRNDAVETISSEALRKYAENKTKHVLLRRALGYFPTLTKDSLFEQLRGEQRPERRRSLLGLLEAYGSIARGHALLELDNELKRDPAEIDTYYLRNVIYLLHRIPRDPDEPADKELELLTRATARGQNIYVVKEALTPMGQLRTEATVKVLTMRLAEYEAMLVRKDTSQYPMDEMQKALDRLIAALARIATPAALLTIARHGMKANPLLGDTRGRLTTLAQHDLSFDEKTVDILIAAIREDLPSTILGRVMPSRQPPPLRVIEALSGTRSEKVDALFTEIAERFADHDVGRAASAMLAKLASVSAPQAKQQGATLTGDLDFFGLPSLMQSLADQQATGIVTLNARNTGQTFGKLLFVGGRFADAQTAHLRGSEALYQMLERPMTGTFAFVPHTTQPKTKSEPIDVMPLLFEGIRRHDELRQMLIFVPDDLVLHATSVKPTPDPEETDPGLIREVWVKSSSGATVGEWEATIPVDSYRVRRLVGRWLEEGAVQPVA